MMLLGMQLQSDPLSLLVQSAWSKHENKNTPDTPELIKKFLQAD